MIKLQYVVFYTSDIGRARAFYEDLLGYVPIEDVGSFIGFVIGDALLGIKSASEPRERPGCQTMIIGCSDLDAWWNKCAQFEAMVSSPIVSEDWGRNFAILDPDGNKVEFVETVIAH